MEFLVSNKATPLDLVSRYNRVKEFVIRVSGFYHSNLVNMGFQLQQSSSDQEDTCSKWSMSDKFRWDNQDD